MEIILSVDLGTSGMKVGLVKISGEIIAWEQEPVDLYLFEDGGAEQSPKQWWSAFIKITKRLLEKNPSFKKDIVAICCSTQGEGTIPVDKNGEILHNCILWMDMRGAKSLKKQFKGLINYEGVSISQVIRWIRLTAGMPSLTGKDPAGHMLYIKDYMPDIYKKTYKFLNVLDYLNLKLTGKFVATYDSILTSWVTDNRNPEKIEYSTALLKRSGIDNDKFPEIVSPTDIVGNIKPEIASEFGLNENVKVVAGSIDTTAAAIGSGAVEDYQLHLYLGTSSWLAAHLPFKKTDLVHSIASLPCAIPSRYLLIGLQATAGGNLVFLKDNILYHKDELLLEAQKPDIYKVLDQIAQRVPAGANGIIYTPWIWGERAPVDNRFIRAGLYNISLKNTREDIIRAFFEGVALNTRWLLSPVEKFMKKKAKRINLIGGGAQSDTWCQIFADVLGTEIYQVENPILANMRGAAWIASVGIGKLSFSDIPKLIKYKKIYEPQPEIKKVYDGLFANFNEIYKRMNGYYTKVNK
jgi:xylulokinase